MTEDERYLPIDCALHDELQLLVLRRAVVDLVVRGDDGDPVPLRGRATDVLTRAGAEWLALEDGTFVRLDRLVEVDGRPFAARC